jgi:hypothetical protein
LTIGEHPRDVAVLTGDFSLNVVNDHSNFVGLGSVLDSAAIRSEEVNEDIFRNGDGCVVEFVARNDSDFVVTVSGSQNAQVSHVDDGFGWARSDNPRGGDVGDGTVDDVFDGLIDKGRVRSVGLDTDQVSARLVTFRNRVLSQLFLISKVQGDVREADVHLSLSVSCSKLNHDEFVNTNTSGD